MSVYSLHSIAFAKWFLHKHLSTFISDSSTIDYIISLLNNDTWDDFTHSESHSIAKSTADTLIPILVQTTNIQKNHTNKPKPKPKPRNSKSTFPPSFRVDAATYTDLLPYEHNIYSIHAPAPAPEPDVLSDKQTLRSKSKKTLQNIIVDNVVDDNVVVDNVVVDNVVVDNVVTDVVADVDGQNTIPVLVDKPDKKKREPKSKKTLQNIIVDNVVTDVVADVDGQNTIPVLVDKPDKKKREPKSKKTLQNIIVADVVDNVVVDNVVVDEVVADVDGQNAIPVLVDKPDKKKREPKSKKTLQNIIVDNVVDDVVADVVADNVVDVVVDEVVADVDGQNTIPVPVLVDKPDKKKRGPKSKKTLQNIVVDNVADVDGQNAIPVLVDKPDKKKREPKSKKTLQNIIVDNVADVVADNVVDNVVVDVVVDNVVDVVVDKPDKKKRGPKSKKTLQNIIVDNVVADVEVVHRPEHDNQIIPDLLDEPEKKKRGSKSKHFNHDSPVEIIVPILHNHGDELTSDSYNTQYDELTLTECFIGDDLYYIDSYGNYYNQSFSLISNPLCSDRQT